MQRLFGHPWGWTSLAPLACAVHCAVTPILIVVAPALAPGKFVEWALLALTVVFAGSALAIGTRRHGDLRPVWPILGGVAVWTASLLHLFHPIPEEATTIVASLTVAAGLIWNARIHCACDRPDAPDCPVCEATDGTAEEGLPAPSTLNGTSTLHTLKG